VATQVERSQVKILIADDDMEILRILRARLSKRGYQLVEAHDGEEALQVALADQPNVLVLDVMMPRLNGWEVCKYLRDREAYANIGVLMLTGIGATLNELTSPLYGADEHLDKPFELDEVEAGIERILLERCDMEVIDS
jgi:DNA-binding response OmpR family regulator